MDAKAMEALVGRFFDAIEAGDIDAVSEIYAPNAVIWHNNDQLETGREQNLETLRGFVRAVPERRYENRKIRVYEGGFTEQHMLRGKLANGGTLELPACIICEVKDGKITRLDEYFDTAHLAPLLGRAPAAADAG